MSDSKVNLPKTSFPMKANLPLKEPEILNFWQKINLYQKQRELKKGKEKYVLHDGPPYANGNIHIGTALNKILKDIVVKFKNIEGYDAPYVPGWDCHGLPIEWKIEEINKEKGINKKDLSVIDFRSQCRNFATKWIDIQKQQFQRLGVLGDWENYYSTMHYAAEAQIAKEILNFLKNGSLYMGYKPVLWSVVESTALSDAEVEYKDHVSNTIYVKFKIKEKFKGFKDVNIVIWTTTPWTIPCNRALAYNTEFEYGIYETEEKEKIILASKLADFFSKETNKKIKQLSIFNGSEFKNLKCSHPLINLGYDYDIPMLEAEFVTLEQGTGVVHVAPSHGPDDFILGLKNNIKAENTIDDLGYYTDIIKSFSGVHIFKADKIVIEKLKEAKNLLYTNQIKHSYPHSWRSKAPLIHRATLQWFISMEKNLLRKKALEAIDNTHFFPEIGKNRIKGMIESRPDWCISRQRFWGVPLPIFVNKKTKEPIIDEEVFNKIYDIFLKEGSDTWFTKEKKYFLTNRYRENEYEKVTDIVEVWFDSGSTHTYVLETRNDLKWPADLYLEGSDQHRGWFHSSLLHSCGTRNRAPYNNILTHGFVVDGKGQKMSKSLGNVILPEDIIKNYGAEILRLWVVASDYSEDLKIDKNILSQHSESYRKIRNTFRFLLGNINDDISLNEVKDIKINDLNEIDNYILNLISQLDKKFLNFSKNYEFHKIYVELLNFCTVDLSAFYFDIKKDVLYCDDIQSKARKSCIKILRISLFFLLKWFSPILSFTTEEIYQIIKKNNITQSIFLYDFNELNKSEIKNEDQKWSFLKKIKTETNHLIEELRNNKIIGSSLEVNVHLLVENQYLSYFDGINISEFLICSSATLNNENIDKTRFRKNESIKLFSIFVEKAEGQKCSHCWKIINKNCGRINCSVKK